MIKKTYTSLLLILPALLCGCLDTGGVSMKQAHLLKQEGFKLDHHNEWALGLPRRLLFNFDDARPSKIDSENVKELAYKLKQYNLNKLKIIGHADDIGNESYNIELSKQRADNIASIFYKNGFKKENIRTLGKGSSQPISFTKDHYSRVNNRRVTIVIVPNSF